MNRSPIQVVRGGTKVSHHQTRPVQNVPLGQTQRRELGPAVKGKGKTGQTKARLRCRSEKPLGKTNNRKVISGEKAVAGLGRKDTGKPKGGGFGKIS